MTKHVKNIEVLCRILINALFRYKLNTYKVKIESLEVFFIPLSPVEAGVLALVEWIKMKMNGRTRRCMYENIGDRR